MRQAMELILLEHVHRLGGIGDVVKVKDGYGRNFLIPQKKALRATKANVEEIAARKEALGKLNNEKRAAAQQQAEKLGSLSVKVVRQASEDGRLFGSVAVRDVAEALAAAGHTFSRPQIDLTSTIKSLGTYTARITLHPEVKIECAVEVVRTLESSKSTAA
jgi:large subunit ribosomal protein L9